MRILIRLWCILSLSRSSIGTIPGHWPRRKPVDNTEHQEAALSTVWGSDLWPLQLVGGANKTAWLKLRSRESTLIQGKSRETQSKQRRPVARIKVHGSEKKKDRGNSGINSRLRGLQGCLMCFWGTASYLWNSFSSQLWSETRSSILVGARGHKNELLRAPS